VSQLWWAAFAPAEAALSCGDAEHRLRWADGRLQAADHPDADGELVLGALGGDTSPCLDMVMAWGRHSDDLAVLAVGPRSDTDRLTFPAAVLDQANAFSGAAGQPYHGLGNPVAQRGYSGGGFIRRGPAAGSAYTFRSGRSAGSGRPIPAPAIRRAALRRARVLGGTDRDVQARSELIKLLALGAPFQFRLCAAVASAWSAGGEQKGRAERARPALIAALAGRVAPAAAHWLGMDPEKVEASAHESEGWGELALTKTGRLEARLPVSWLASVWAPGFAVVDGHLVVSVLDAGWPGARVLAVRSPGKEPVQLSILSDKGHWIVTSQ
jgi:hypothetical protein